MLVSARHLRRRRDRRADAARRGFSLLEMLIVLSILAALTLIAVQSLEPVEQQARQHATRQTLENVKKAILSVNQTGGQTVVGGFAADMGHLPDTTSAQTFVNDLIHNSPALGLTRSLFGSVPGHTCGWRGAYLQTATSTTQLLDAWNRPLSVGFCDYSGTPILTLSNASDRIVIGSLGSPVDGTAPITTTLTYGSLTAMPLTVRICATDTSGMKTALTGTVSLTLVGGLSATTFGAVAQTVVPETSVSGNDPAFAFYPTPAQLLVGSRELIVTFTADATMTGYTVTSPQSFYLNLLPGTSPTQEVIVARQN